MPAILRPGAWLARQQPQVSVEIDWTHPIARGMVMCVMVRPGLGPIDLTGRAREFINVVPGIPIRPGGLALDLFEMSNASTADLDFTSGGWAIGSFFHLATTGTSGSSPSVMSRISYSSESVNSGWILQYAAQASPAWAMQCFANNDFSNYYTQGTSTPVVGDHLLGMTSDGAATRQLVVNGVQEATTVTNLNPLTSANNFATLAGSIATTDGNYLTLAWNRDVLLPEWAWLSAEPYCFLRPRFAVVACAPAVPHATAAATGSGSAAAIGAETASATGVADGVGAVNGIGTGVTAAVGGSSGAGAASSVAHVTGDITQVHIRALEIIVDLLLSVELVIRGDSTTDLDGLRSMLRDAQNDM